jgi:hypothetical protein
VKATHLISIIPSSLRVRPLPLTPEHRRVNPQPPTEFPSIHAHDLIPPRRSTQVRRVRCVADEVDGLGGTEDLGVDGDAAVGGVGVGLGGEGGGEEGEKRFGVVGHSDRVERAVGEVSVSNGREEIEEGERTYRPSS